MWNKIQSWYRGLSDQWKATLRSAWQGIIGAVGVLVLSILAEAQDLLEGGELTHSLDHLSIAAKAFASALVGVGTGIVTYWMNRGSRGASYDAEA